MAVFIIILFVIISALFLNYLYKQTNHYKNQFADINKIRENDIHKLDIVNLGSNQPKFAFDYSDLDISGMNWGVGPQSLEYDYSILKKEYKKIKKGGIVIIPICPLKMFLLKHKSGHVKYYNYLDAKEIVSYSRKTKLKEIDFPLLFYPKRIRFLIKDITKDKRLKLDNNPMNREQVKEDADYWINVWNKEFNIDINNITLSEKNKEHIEKNIQLLKEMLSFCVDNNLQPILALIPVTRELNKKFPKNFVDDYILKYLEEANVQVQAPILNFFNDERFFNSDLYINSFFLNKGGRKIFTNTFVEELKANNIL